LINSETISVGFYQADIIVHCPTNSLKQRRGLQNILSDNHVKHLPGRHALLLVSTFKYIQVVQWSPLLFFLGAFYLPNTLFSMALKIKYVMRVEAPKGERQLSLPKGSKSV
jgi:hypothetical protein